MRSTVFDRTLAVQEISVNSTIFITVPPGASHVWVEVGPRPLVLTIATVSDVIRELRSLGALTHADGSRAITAVCICE